MLVDGSTSNKKALGERIFREGIQLWKKQQEFARLKKLQEQQEMREMLEKYCPFGHATDMKPRGFKNLRLQGLFPNTDYMNAKRFVGTLDLGRGGGGAPMVSNTGKKVTRMHEDPMLRFQFGHDLRRCVDNTLRYKTTKRAQEEYKKELDKQVEEKRRNEERQSFEDEEILQKQFSKTPPWGKQGPGGFNWRKPNTIGLNFLKSLGWSTEKRLKQLDIEVSEANKTQKELEKTKSNVKNKARKFDPIFYPCKNVYVGSKNRKLSPLPNGKENGIELVPILAKQRRNPVKIPLDTTDVTNLKKINLSTLWNRQGSSYLRELTQQMVYKQQKLKEMKVEDDETGRHHFDTCNGFWGRPGHGAPKSAVKKQKLDRLLYPQMVPISAHFFILVLATTYAKEEETNEVKPPGKQSPNLDANLRRALLKALTELENEENEKKQRLSQENLPHLDLSDKVVEKASASALSFFASTDSTPTTSKSSSTTEEATAKPIVVVQRSHGLQHKPIITLDKYKTDSSNEAEQILTSASSSFTSASNKLYSKVESQSPNLVSNEVKATTKFFRLPKVESTTVTTTTSTEESEAKVEDVQFFSAPLVAAFTPSLSFTSNQHPTGVLPLNAQQLPVKNAIDFRSPFSTADKFHQFNYLSHQQPPLEGSVSSFNLVPTIQPQLSLTAPKHHRVFRQEGSTGNFFSNGFNNFNNYYNQVPSQQQNNNRFFRSNIESATSPPFTFNRIQPPVVNQQLNHLLYNSGLIR
ncbi:unnamed protein product, partial [Tenebrio molitor]